MLKDNTEFKLPSLKGGSYSGMDRLFISQDNLVLRGIERRKDTGDIELITQAKDGQEQKMGKIIFKKDNALKKEILYKWLNKHLGETIDRIYSSQFDFKDYPIDLARQADEGIQYLLDRPELEKKIKYYKDLENLQKTIRKFVLKGNIELLGEPLKFYRRTNGLVQEGGDTYETTIWNTQVQVRGKAEYLENIFNNLEDIRNITLRSNSN